MSVPATYRETRDVAVRDLVHYPGNSRRGDVDAIRASIRKQGQYRALIVRHTDDGQLIVLAGNHTLMALRAEGAGHARCEIHECDDATARRINIADNKISELGDYDNDALLEELSYLDGDYDGTGWTQGEIDARLDGYPPDDADAIDAYDEDEDPTVIPPGALNDPDDAPLPPEATPTSAVGDVWELGPHRLVVGDATDPLVWDTVLAGEKGDMVWTDPPYGVEVVGGNRTLPEAERLARGGKTIKNDDLKGEALGELLHGIFGNAFISTRPGACWYVASPPGPLFLVFGRILDDLKVWRQTLMWVKNSFVLGRSDYHYRHEPIFYGWTPGAAHHAVPDRSQDSVHAADRPKRSADHPTMKPVALIRRHIENSTDPGELVIDPCGGSGSTLLAAHGAGRRAALIELDPKYADVICRRYQEHAGVLPRRDGVEVDFLADREDAAAA